MWLQPHMVPARPIIMPKASQVQIPLHPLIPLPQQVIFPNEVSRKMLSSYARFVAKRFAHHPEKGARI